MLYVFHVDVGRMLNFDMTVALSSVENLKDTIERLHGIPAVNIVLLVSGGEMLTSSTQVSYYSAGTDTNPIYMFLTGDVKLPPIMPPVEADLDLREQVERSLELPPVYDTVVKRAQIASRMHDLARDEERMCERLVHEQHLQQQGWSAVVANMEDLTEEFRQRFRTFCEAFDTHLKKRSSYLELLRNFADDLTKLSRIPILPGLMPLAEADFHGFDEFLENDDVFSRSTNAQESVLLAGANPDADGAASAEDTVSGVQKPVENANVGESATGGSSSDNRDDKSTSSTSTSPNKKLKMGTDSNEERISQTSQTSTSSTARRLNLLQWITSKENHNALKTMSDECVQGLGTFNEDVYEKLKHEVQNIIKLAEQGDVKEIKGLGERLCKLEEFKYKIKSMVKDQRELSTAFQQNQNRAINLRDASILPDLCASHQSQLLVMLQNHQKIRDHRRCIAKAKDELGSNLYARLKRIVYIENAMSEFDNRLLFYLRCLRRAERHIHIIDQIHQAPNMYVAAVTEVMRRKIFSSEFRLWASKLAEDFDGIHSEEMKRRQQFNVNFEGHFLNILFPGMTDMPPAFANEYPLVFDARLPNITKSDIDVLTTHLPEMASQIQLPDMEPVIYFFVSRSGTHQRERFEELLKQKQNESEMHDCLKLLSAEDVEQTNATSSCKVSAMQTSGKMLTNPRVNELRKADATAAGGDESETDTETEFEQVTALSNQQSVATSTTENQFQLQTIAKSTITDEILMQSAETLTEENAETLRVEVIRMRAMLGAMSKLALDCIQLARTNLQTFREETMTQKEDLHSELQNLNDKWNVIRMQCEAREQEISREMEKGEQDMLMLAKELEKRSAELQAEREQNREMATMRIKCATLEAQLEELREKLKFVDAERNQAVSEAREKLIHEHKTEIESLRQRFKLMTSMEKYPSDQNLDAPTTSERSSLEQQHVIDKTQHESVLKQLRMELEAEKERAIAAAIEMAKIFPLNSESVMANVTVLKQMLEEKERQLEQLREKDLMLTKENYQLKTRLDALTNEEGNSWLKEKIDYLHRDKCRLEEELNQEKSKRLEMETSVAALRGSTHEQAVIPHSQSSGSSHKFIVLEGCTKGDLVFVVWSLRHGQFMVVQDSPSLYFVHGDSLAALNLGLPDNSDEPTIPLPYYAIGRVIDKQYCQARKDENRYRVKKGSKFYRIKLAPLMSRQSMRRERVEYFTMSISRSISQCETHNYAALAPASSSSLSATTSMTVTTSINAATANDIVDGLSGAEALPPLATSPITVITTTASQSMANSAGGTPMLAFKERTMSITSVTEEDDEPISLLSDRCRYISVSEEDENAIAEMVEETMAGIMTTTATVAAATAPTLGAVVTATNLQPTVITEQPTATASKLELDLMLASADINTTTDTPYTITIEPTGEAEENTVTNINNNTVCSSSSSSSLNTNTAASTLAALNMPEVVGGNRDDDDVDAASTFMPQIMVPSMETLHHQQQLSATTTAAIFISPPPPQPSSSSPSEMAEKSSPSIPTSIGTTTSEDSDEYRSLEPKDDQDFPISE
ncbi:RB1-inducible coiled-coil protein 1 [Stomoxys calcitrans]|uniref:RB1-inducible coiled-coil protein 1 n=1 Tax=Stomoxys calcitrans TaxID=35570 RepID=UPI0027E3A6BB|nr:RB1-inducible coiled-coil protein 1 [Stomoxys calcitrans]XP_059218262.1 RB1-inducible coiled-coil protein 1 [Stomoxys calcitrans]XP_059218263.1 RB1-inducible coiled-coil protein 1 [Stomoxys calcitrans]XP_059218264.1 RB1-inducible coiled-coil protein 1 [Stomoxys calcitrans]